MVPHPPIQPMTEAPQHPMLVAVEIPKIPIANFVFLAILVCANFFEQASFGQNDGKVAANQGTARLVIYRPGKFVSAWGRAGIYLNREYVGTLKNSEFIERQVSPGDITVLSNIDIPEPGRVLPPPNLLKIESRQPSVGPCSGSTTPECIQELRKARLDNAASRNLYLCEVAKDLPSPPPYHYHDGPFSDLSVTITSVAANGTATTIQTSGLTPPDGLKAGTDSNGTTTSIQTSGSFSCHISVNLLLAVLADDPKDWPKAGYYATHFRAEPGKTYYIKRFYTIDGGGVEEVDSEHGEKDTRHLKPTKVYARVSGMP